jgi:inosine-uridine nucleoside N-ribohydrolase
VWQSGISGLILWPPLRFFASGVPIHLAPLDATNQILWTEADARGWVSSGSPEGALAAELLQWMLDSWSVQRVYIWDLVAAVNATDPALCPEVPLAVDIVVAPGLEQGQTVVTDQLPNVTVCLDPDPEGIKALTAAVLGR